MTRFLTRTLLALLFALQCSIGTWLSGKPLLLPSASRTRVVHVFVGLRPRRRPPPAHALAAWKRRRAERRNRTRAPQS